MSDRVEKGAGHICGEREGAVPIPRVKRCLKTVAAGLARVLVMPVYLSFLLREVMFGEQAFRASSQLVSLLPGFFGDYLRVAFYRLTLAACGRDVQICFGTLFSSRRASIGDHVYIGTHCMVGNVEIARDVLLGSNVHLLSGQRQHSIGEIERPIRLQERRADRIRIGEDTWIGNGAIVMAHVGRKSVVGAGSVVVSDIPDLSLAAGNPARVLRSRG